MRMNTWITCIVFGIALSGCKFEPKGVPDGDGGIPDAAPDSNPGLDEDNDGIVNGDDNCDFVANPQQENGDTDAFGDACDNCDAVDNDDQADTDGDMEGNACDDDDDGDTVLDVDDNCPGDANQDQANTDGDGEGDACDGDDDGDNVADGADNCPLVANTNQGNVDGDAQGDICDPDADNDGVLNDDDPCPLVNNPAQTQDEDGDGVGDPCDNCPSIANPGQENVMDNDTVGDDCDPRPTLDGDSIAFFDGFNTAGAPPGWTVASGTLEASTPTNYTTGVWANTGGQLTIAFPAATDPTALYRSTGSPLGNVFIDTTVTITTLPLDDYNPPAQIGLLTAYANASATGGTDTGYACWLQWQGNTTTDPVSRVRATGLSPYDTASTNDIGNGFDPILTSTYRITQKLSGTRAIDCQAVADPAGTAQPSSFPRSFADGPTMGTIGIITRRVGAAFDYIVVYSLGG